MPRPKAKRDTATRTLQNLALGEDEALLYTRMLERPRSTVQELSTRTPFPRTLLYYILKKLEERSLVTAIKDGPRTVFVAEDPERLYDLLADKEREFEREAAAVRDIVPALKRRYRLAGKRPSVRSFEGVEEYRKALEDIVASRPEEILSYEMPDARKPGLETRESHDRSRVARKLRKKVLFFETSASLCAVKARPYDDYTEFRAIAGGTLEAFSAEVLLYDGKLLYTSLADEHEPVALLIEDEALYGMQRNLFLSLWKEGVDRTLAYTEKA